MRMAAGTEGACGGIGQGAIFTAEEDHDGEMTTNRIQQSFSTTSRVRCLYTRNSFSKTTRKMVTAMSCCGHPGEPGLMTGF